MTHHLRPSFARSAPTPPSISALEPASTSIIAAAKKQNDQDDYQQCGGVHFAPFLLPLVGHAACAPIDLKSMLERYRPASNAAFLVANTQFPAYGTAI
jgi:hypothetical protein